MAVRFNSPRTMQRQWRWGGESLDHTSRAPSHLHLVARHTVRQSLTTRPTGNTHSLCDLQGSFADQLSLSVLGATTQTHTHTHTHMNTPKLSERNQSHEIPSVDNKDSRAPWALDSIIRGVRGGH